MDFFYPLTAELTKKFWAKRIYEGGLLLCWKERKWPLVGRFHTAVMGYVSNYLRTKFIAMVHQPAVIISTRTRATYYQPSRRWPPRFIRRFMLRYPQGHLYVVLGICSTGMVFPASIWMYKALTMDKEELIDYRNRYNAIVRDRQKYGRQLAFPFFFPSESNVEKSQAEQQHQS